MNSYQPIKITAYLRCGVITDAYLPIDGVLYYQAYRDAYGPETLTLPGDSMSGVGEVPILLQRRNLPYDGFHYADGAPLWQGQHEHRVKTSETPWYYAASFAQWNGTVAEGTDHWNKRFDMSLAHLVDFQGKRGKVIVEQGEFKAYHMPIHYRHALSVSWYVVGDITWVREMLSTVTHLGKKTSQGWGAVGRWEIEPFAHDWSVYGPNGRLMRSIPSERGIRTGLRPSYWMPQNQFVCEVPR